MRIIKKCEKNNFISNLKFQYGDKKAGKGIVFYLLKS